MNEFEVNYLSDYFNNLSEDQKTQLFLDMFEELEMQEIVSGPCKSDVEEDPSFVPYWAHTGDPLVE